MLSRSPLSTIALLAALSLATSGIVGCCSVCKRALARKSHSSPTSSASTSTPTSPTASAAPTATTPSFSRFVHDLFPKRRGFLPPAVYLHHAGRRVEQLNPLSDFFDKLPTDGPAQGLQDGLVVCSLSVLGQFDDFRPPDVSADLSVGKTLKYHYHGPEDRSRSYFSIPQATWSPGDQLVVKAVDRDVFSDEFIGEVKLSFNGRFPLLVNHKEFLMECRAWEASQVENAARAQSTVVSQAITNARKRLRPDPEAADWGWPATGMPEAWLGWDQLAALIGARNPRAQSLGTELEQIEKDWSSLTSKSVAAEIAKRPALTKQPRLKFEKAIVNVEGVTCDAARVQQLATKHHFLHASQSLSPCFVQLDIERLAPADDALFFSLRLDLSAALVTAQGDDVATRILAVESTGESSEEEWPKNRGDHAKVFLLPSQDVALGSHPGTSPANDGGPVHLIRFPKAYGTLGSTLFRVD